MKTMKLKEIRKRNYEHRDAAIRAVRKVNLHFKPGDHTFDRLRKNKDKQKFLDEMRIKENEIQRKTT